MADQNDRKKVIAVVPAFNEAERLGAVLAVLGQYPFDEVVVVDDGSSDATAERAAAYPVRVMRLPENRGKGEALDEALRTIEYDVVFFCDADVRGLTKRVIEETLQPVLAGETEMMIAMRNRTIYYLSFIFSVIPLLGGERALTARLWQAVPQEFKRGFMIEAALNHYARHRFAGFRFKVFEGLTQTIKEKKYGLWRGCMARVAMFREIIAAEAQLQRVKRAEPAAAAAPVERTR
jgi:glycosyltransferase involved in cell wall biosynthesis